VLQNFCTENKIKLPVVERQLGRIGHDTRYARMINHRGYQINCRHFSVTISHQSREMSVPRTHVKRGMTGTRHQPEQIGRTLPLRQCRPIISEIHRPPTSA